MQQIFDKLGQPDRIEAYNSHRWHIGEYLLCIMPRETSTGTWYLFNFFENGKSVGGGQTDSLDFMMEAIENQLRHIERSAEK